VIADSSGQVVWKDKKFDTVKVTCDYARDLFCRWTAVRNWRVVNEAGEIQGVV
jgi:hypothetical protein